MPASAASSLLDTLCTNWAFKMLVRPTPFVQGGTLMELLLFWEEEMVTVAQRTIHVSSGAQHMAQRGPTHRLQRICRAIMMECLSHASCTNMHVALMCTGLQGCVVIPVPE